MTSFSDDELAYINSDKRLGRLATVSKNGTPHVTPVGCTIKAADGPVEIGGIDLTATKKWRDVAATGRAAVVIDDVLPPWKPRGVEVRGRAEVSDGPTPVIRIHPERIVSWGLDSQ